MLKIKLSPFLRDIASTTVTSILLIISTIFVTRFLAKGLGPDAFGAYSLARRIISFVIPFSTLSMGIALTRYVAISTEHKSRNNYLVSTIFIVFSISSILFLLASSGGKTFTMIIFHDSKYFALFYSSLVMLVGFGFSTVLYSYYRGIQRINMANLWQVCIFGFLPLIIAYEFAQKGSVALIVFLMGLSSFLSVFPLIIFLRKICWGPVGQFKSSFKDLLKYGIPRTPGGMTLEGLLAIGPFLAPYFGNMRDAGYLVVGQSVFRILEASIAAFGVVALPKVAQLISEGSTAFLRNRISDILALIIHLGLFVIVQLFIWANEIVSIWVGPQYLEAVPIIRIFLISLCPYIAYTMLRSIIDAVEDRAINTFNLLISFAITALLCFLFAIAGLGVLGLAIAMTMGFFTLGISTAYFLVKRYNISLRNLKLRLILPANLIFAAISIIAKQYFIVRFSKSIIIIPLFLIECPLFLSYIWLLYKKDTDWVRELTKRVSSTNF